MKFTNVFTFHRSKLRNFCEMTWGFWIRWVCWWWSRVAGWNEKHNDSRRGPEVLKGRLDSALNHLENKYFKLLLITHQLPSIQTQSTLRPYYIITYIYIPVVPHKAVAEVSRIGNYRRDWLLWVTDGRAKTLMDRTVQQRNWLTD